MYVSCQAKLMPHLKLQCDLAIFWLPIHGKLSSWVQIEPMCPLERLQYRCKIILTWEGLHRFKILSLQILFFFVLQKLEKSTDLCPHVPTRGQQAARGTFAYPWPLVISLHIPFSAPFLLNLQTLSLWHLKNFRC